MAYVVDASVAIKWVIGETGSEHALSLLAAGGLCAPDLIVAECANILWKKTARGFISGDVARLAARVIAEAPFEIAPSRGLLEAATALAIALNHPAYDCVYLALARERRLQLVTADEKLIANLAQSGSNAMRDLAVSLAEAAAAIEPRV
jgi:predicted nucleic acid-binding protein